MRPIRLHIAAFGPFAGAEEIDFGKLGVNPLFLINGPTGAGKSTILDAICFALYGETTGNERDAKQMRCDYADAATLTEVTLEFELADKRYRITRAPDQTRLKVRGEGTTEQKARAALYSLENDEAHLLVSPKITEVTDRIVELTGLSAEQFRQVMVLPQGRFRDLLMARSEDRESIFQQLFQTHVYSALQNRLREQANALTTKIKECENQTNALLEVQNLTDIDALNTELALLADSIKKMADERETLSGKLKAAQQQFHQANILDRVFADHQKTQSQLNQLELRQTEIDRQKKNLEKAQSASLIEPIYRQFNNQKKILESSEHQFLNAKKILEKANVELALLEKKKNTLAEKEDKLAASTAGLIELENYRERSQQLSEAKQQMFSLEKVLSNSRSQLEKKQKLIQQKKQGLAKSETFWQAQNDAISVLPEKITLLDKLEEKGKKIRKIMDFQSQLTELTRFEQELKCREKAEQAQVEESSRERDAYERSWVNGQAAILATTLHENEACPVCGSLHHPLIAVSDKKLPTEKEMNNIRQQVIIARDNLEKIRRERLVKAEEIKNINKLLDEENIDISDASDLLLADIRKQFQAQRSVILRLQKEKDTLPKLQEEIEISKKEIALLESELGIMTENLTKKHGEFSAAENNVKMKEAELPKAYRDSQVLERTIAEARIERDKIKREISEFHATYQQAREQKVSADIGLMSAKQQQSQVQAQYSKLDENWVNCLKQSSFCDEKDFLSAMMAQKQLDENIKDIRQYEDEKLLLTKKLESERLAIADKTRPDIADLKHRENQLTNEKNALDTEFHKMRQRQDLLHSTKKILDNILSERHCLEAEYGVVGKLSDVSNGKNPHNLSLQRFVLSVLLDDVLTEASQRLVKMSKGRYQLYRNEAVADKRIKAGLDLLVEDAYTGKQRAAATLSGGESFMAALALALGLSDVVQAYAGGIRLDTLFIDEGFGSLDSESLELAMNTLMELRDSGRMVGIISHVDELKRMIDVRLDVLGNREHSYTRLVGV